MQQNRRKSTTFHLITSVCNSFIFFDFDKFHIFISTLYRIIFYLCSKHKTEYYENQRFTIISIRNKQLTLDCTRHKTPLPAKQGGEPLLQVLSKRASTRDFDTQKNIDSQTLSNLLWAAWGYNREDKRTAPSAMNRQEISLYIVTAQGVYLYDAKQNKLAEIAKGDFRENAGMQPFVHTAPLNIIFTADLEKAPGNDMMFVDCGFISQNIYLYCASVGLGTVVRGSFNGDELAKILKLNEKQKVVLTQTVGYPAK